ncbi:hypothetical protein ZEAMMB73_Zm00001d040056 [Zea mays]|uniref:Uncharacterized protein n=1 Tax=Zea mays TaxID=4577 RepID=A0A1D6MMV0_MAIZE|nr:hypothetical protein ZEAMMB73_Zm00001d040056 [Zea mays]
MGFRAASAAAAAAVAVFAAAGLAVTAASSGDSLADLGGAAREIESAPEVKNLGPWAKGLLKGMPQAAAGPAAMAPVAKYPLVLAEDRTRRPDVLRHLKVYEGGWNVTNKHYWAVSCIDLHSRGAACSCVPWIRPREVWTEIYSLHICYLMLESCGGSLYPSRDFPDTKQGTKSTNTTLQSSGNSAAQDTCEAMDQWAQHPQAETALSSILPCVDESTTNRTLYQSKEVVVRLVGIVNRAISALSNRRPHHKHPGQFMPYLCSPYDSNLNDRPCKYREATFENATTAWLNYTCMAQDTDLCSGNKTLTYDIYGQLVLAANVSYALYHYAPFLLNLQDCKFVRATFSAIASRYCPPLGHDLVLVSAGLALIASAFVLCLVWMLFADRPRREEVSDLASGSRIAPVDSSPS